MENENSDSNVLVVLRASTIESTVLVVVGGVVDVVDVVAQQSRRAHTHTHTHTHTQTYTKSDSERAKEQIGQAGKQTGRRHGGKESHTSEPEPLQ